MTWWSRTEINYDPQAHVAATNNECDQRQPKSFNGPVIAQVRCVTEMTVFRTMQLLLHEE
jgi:hypothetical protein